MSWFSKLFGPRADAPPPASMRDPEPLRFRVEEAEALRGSPAGTRAWIGRLGNGGQEARFRLELSPEASQVSEEFAFSGGGFWREPRRVVGAGAVRGVWRGVAGGGDEDEQAAGAD